MKKNALVKKLSELSLSAEKFEDILTLPPPEQVLENLKSTELEKICSNFVKIWNDFLNIEINKKINEENETGSTNIQNRLFYIICSYYDYAVRKFISKNNKTLPPGLNIDQISKLLSINEKISSVERMELRIFSGFLFSVLALEHISHRCLEGSLCRICR